MKKVKMQTTKGTIVLELDDEKAPETVRNFVEYVQAGHYDGTIFHRVIDGFMIQGGGFTKDMNQKKTRAPIRNEASNGLHNKRGTIAMARTMVVDSATSQFFTDGMDVVDAIAKVKTGYHGPHQNVPEEAIVVTRAAVI